MCGTGTVGPYFSRRYRGNARFPSDSPHPSRGIDRGTTSSAMRQENTPLLARAPRQQHASGGRGGKPPRKMGATGEFFSKFYVAPR